MASSEKVVRPCTNSRTRLSWRASRLPRPGRALLHKRRLPKRWARHQPTHVRLLRPDAHFCAQYLRTFTVSEPLDLCFLYFLHYSGSIKRLKACIASVHNALAEGGVFCFNAVDKNMIANESFVAHTAQHEDGVFGFSSAWSYPGEGERQALKLKIERAVGGQTQVWHDEHPMVAVSFAQLTALLEPGFEVHMFAHDYQKLVPWEGRRGMWCLFV